MSGNGFEITRLASPTGADLAVRELRTKKRAKAVVHITHGMGEHSERYERLAKVLASNGYHVVAHDHRGHGYTKAPDAPLGSFGKPDGFTSVIDDINAVNMAIRNDFPGLPVILFGHSMGAITGLNYCMRYPESADAAMLWNSGVDGGLLLMIYGLLLRIERMFKGSDAASAIAKKLTFETWNRKFAPNRTAFDWLSRDEAEVDKYVADPLCGFDASNGLWSDLLEGIRDGASNRKLAQIRKSLPIHLQGGGQDPCSDHGKAVARLASRLEAVGITDLTLLISPDNRHEALNELDRDAHMKSIVDWLDHRFG